MEELKDIILFYRNLPDDGLTKRRYIECWFKQFEIIEGEAKKSNRGLMLDGKEVKGYPYSIKLSEFNEPKLWIDCFNGRIFNDPAPVPAQERYREMIEYGHIPFETKEECQESLDYILGLHDVKSVK